MEHRKIAEKLKRSYLSDFKEKFPFSLYEDKDITSEICRVRLYGEGRCLNSDASQCVDCWNQEADHD